eukprot:GEMP01020201.1.p1 GENE.GEMP01020201.1~~GEMP01020201.1.p1  ORF type:complete len:212 (+),score=14.12 GEMP01020201.1:40-636(+)
MPGELEPARASRICDGILYKKSRFLGSIRRRRMILTPDHLFSFSEDPEAVEEDATEIFDLKSIREIVEEGYRVLEDGKVRYMMTLIIRPKSRAPEFLRSRNVVLEARTPRDRSKWIRAIHSRATEAKIIQGPAFKGEHIDQNLHGSPFAESDDCVICFRPIAESAASFRLHCGHAFCVPCLDEWAEHQRMCPLCKRMF